MKKHIPLYILLIMNVLYTSAQEVVGTFVDPNQKNTTVYLKAEDNADDEEILSNIDMNTVGMSEVIQISYAPPIPEPAAAEYDLDVTSTTTIQRTSRAHLTQLEATNTSVAITPIQQRVSKAPSRKNMTSFVANNRSTRSRLEKEKRERIAARNAERRAAAAATDEERIISVAYGAPTPRGENAAKSDGTTGKTTRVKTKRRKVRVKRWKSDRRGRKVNWNSCFDF